MKRIIFILFLPLFIGAVAHDGTWDELFVRGNTYCSSELDAVDPFEEGQGPYGAHNLSDNSMATAWVEGVEGYGDGEYFYIGIGDKLPQTLNIANGYQKSEPIYLKNSRVKNARLSLFAGFFIDGEVTEIASLYRVRQIGEGSVVTIMDKMGMQEIKLPETPRNAIEISLTMKDDFFELFNDRISSVSEHSFGSINPVSFQYFLKFEIIDVYPGSSWDDTCISEINIGEPDPLPVNKREIITRVIDGEDGVIYFDTQLRRGLKLVDIRDLSEFKDSADGVEMWITLMDVSPGNDWAIVDFMFSSVGMRVEEYSVLYHLRSGQRVPLDILNVMYGMYGFSEQDGKLFLDTSGGQIDLDKISQMLHLKL